MTQAKNTVLPKSFGERLRWFRNQRGISQGDLGKTVGRTATSISEWEKNASEPSLELIRIMAETLGVSPERLAYGLPEPAAVHTFPPREEEDDDISKFQVNAPPSRTGEVQLRPEFQPPPPAPTRADCLRYFDEYLRRAEREPGGIGYAYRVLMREFPLDEFEPSKKTGKS